MDKFNYYESQLSQLTDKQVLTIQISDFSGNRTKYMNINSESVDVFIKFLQNEKKRFKKEIKATEETLKTDVIFKLEGDNVVAVMPYEIFDRHGNMTSYARVGQHSPCSPGYVKKIKTATEAEYAELKKELEAAGYTFRVLKRISYGKYLDARMEVQKKSLKIS